MKMTGSGAARNEEKKSDEGGAVASSLARVREKRKNVQPPRVFFVAPLIAKLPPLSFLFELWTNIYR